MNFIQLKITKQSCEKFQGTVANTLERSECCINLTDRPTIIAKNNK